MFRTLGDIKKEEGKGDDKKKKTESYTGGEKSGMAVENPDDIEGVIAQAQKNSDKRKDAGADDKPDTEVKVSLYQNGFTVEGGEFRDYNTEENKDFMKELNAGYIPKELRSKYKTQIGISLEDRRKEKFRLPTPPKYVAYSGSGQSLGGATGVGGTVNKESADGKPTVDES